VPHCDRHGMLWLSRGQLFVESGCLRFSTGGFDGYPGGVYAVPHQTVSAILLGSGGSVTHDAMRIMARHGTCLVAVGDGGVRAYTAPPLRPDTSALARRQVRAWADIDVRRMIARRMYAWRFGEILPDKDLDVLRGMEGARMRRQYQTLAAQHGVEWNGRSFDRENPGAADDVNQAINHAATACYAAAAIAVYATNTVPQLGFIHEDSGDAFCLDVADMYRTEVTVPLAFEAVKASKKDPNINPERHVRLLAGRKFKDGGVIAKMIDRIKEMFGADDDGCDERSGG